MRWVVLGVALFCGGLGVNAADAAAGAGNYALCGSCHGAAGEGIIAMNGPKLAGQSDWYLKSQLVAFKTGLRGATPGDQLGAQMRGMAMTLADDAAVENVVAYIGGLSDAASAVTVDGDAAKGKGLYALCGTCHGVNGEGNAAVNGPKLAGQNDWYLAKQLVKFKKGLRGATPGDTLGAQMRSMAMTLPDDQAVRDVVAYINTLP